MAEYNFSKLENRENTLSTKWDKKAQIFGSSDVLPMWVADSDWQTAPEVKETLVKRAKEGIFGYTFADQSIYQAVQAWLKKRFDLKIKKEWIIFDTGVVPAINFTLNAVTNPEDGIIIQPPVYGPFFEAVEKNNCSLIKNKLLVEDNYYKMDFDGLESIIKKYKNKNKKIKAMILCSPHNPVGRVWKKDELLRLLRILKREDIYLLSDEIHADLIFSGNKQLPVLKLLLERDEFVDYRKKVISFMAASKTFNIAGLHTSYTIIEAKELREKYRAFKEKFGSGNSPFGLLALKTAYLKGEDWLNQQLNYLDKNYKYLKEYITAEIPEIKVTKAEGTYLIWLDCSDLKLKDDQKLFEFMNKKAKVALDPGTWFGDEGSMYMRLNIACPLERLKKGLTRIKDAVNSLK